MPMHKKDSPQVPLQKQETLKRKKSTKNIDPLHIAITESISEIDNEIQKLEEKKENVKQKVIEKEKERIKKQYNKKTDHTEVFCKSIIIFMITIYIMVVGFLVVATIAKVYLSNEKISDNSLQIQQEVIPVIQHFGGNVWSTNGLVNAEKFDEEFKVFSNDHVIKSMEILDGEIVEETDSWCGCPEKVKAYNVWIIAEDDEIVSVQNQ